MVPEEEFVDDGLPEATDNGLREGDPEQDIAQDAGVDYSLESVEEDGE